MELLVEHAHQCLSESPPMRILTAASAARMSGCGVRAQLPCSRIDRSAPGSRGGQLSIDRTPAAQINTLLRYKRRYDLESGSGRSELVEAVTKHFISLVRHAMS